MTVDAVIVSRQQAQTPAQLLLIKRKFEPFKVNVATIGASICMSAWLHGCTAINRISCMSACMA